MQSIQNSVPATQTTTETNTPATTNAATIVSSLPPEALYSQSFQPLYSNLNQSQDFTFPTRPQPFQVSTTQSVLLQNPQQLATSLQTTSQGLGGLLNSLDTGATSDQINQLIQSAQDAAANGDGLTAQKDMAQAQLLFSTMSTLLSMISSLQREAIRNAKIQ
jgi:hypothetical protein